MDEMIGSHFWHFEQTAGWKIMVLVRKTKSCHEVRREGGEGRGRSCELDVLSYSNDFLIYSVMLEAELQSATD